MSAGIHKLDFSSSDDVRTPEKTKVETITIGNIKVARLTAQPGWVWKECIAPVVGTDSCKAKHLGVLAEGSITCLHDDGTKVTYSAGDAYAINPGHDAWVEGDKPAVAYEFHGAWGE